MCSVLAQGTVDMLVETMGTEAELEGSRQKMDEGGGMSITKQDLLWGAFEAEVRRKH